MDAPGREHATPAALYAIQGRRFASNSPGFAEAIANAHAERIRPRCLCKPEGIEMYVARLGEGFVVKRMPFTGSRHAPDCPSHELPADLSGLGQVLGSAIVEDPATGETTLKLDFPLSKMPGRCTTPAAGDGGDSVSASGTRLSLRGLLHYLWDQAELTRWKPGFAGKRNWATVRKLLLQAAAHKATRGQALAQRLYIPEVFSVEQRDALNARRLAHWALAQAAPARPQPLMLLVGEVKELVPARYGLRLVVKHLPDQAFAVDEPLYRRLGRRFEAELALWGATDALHLVTMATFSVHEAGVPALVEVTLMLTTGQWLPVEDSLEQQLLNKLVHEGRSFTKALRYNVPSTAGHAGCILTDTGTGCCPLRIAHGLPDEPALGELAGTHEPGAEPAWVWRPTAGGMPPLPPQAKASHPGHTMA
ncbi:Protein of unknown function (DUF1173) [Burkholderiales bacterium JOSHI_001]|nr:Protein of unknown function (DUF1173) [Burkholderiales bacterium JOSHI_001]